MNTTDNSAHGFTEGAEIDPSWKDIAKAINEQDPLPLVAEFHRKFEHPILPDPAIPGLDRVKLRIELIREEFLELQEAIENDDIVGVADAFCDLQYVLSGAILEFGLGGKFARLFREVQRSNMSKACQTLQEAEATRDHYMNKGTLCHIVERDGLWFVYRTEDMKTLKSINYSEANLRHILGIPEPIPDGGFDDLDKI